MLQAGLQDLVDAEATAHIGVGDYERTDKRTNRRNGMRAKQLATTAREVDSAMPRSRSPCQEHPGREVRVHFARNITSRPGSFQARGRADLDDLCPNHIKRLDRLSGCTLIEPAGLLPPSVQSPPVTFTS